VFDFDFKIEATDYCHRLLVMRLSELFLSDIKRGIHLQVSSAPASSVYQKSFIPWLLVWTHVVEWNEYVEVPVRIAS
jgi:hypothetical protein